MVEEKGVSTRQGCKAVGLARSTYRYKHKPKHDEEVIDALNSLVEQHPAIGFWQAYHRLRHQGYGWNLGAGLPGLHGPRPQYPTSR